MESSLTKACILKIQNFEGPFDLLFHLLEKNKINIYDIPINEITNQYMDYLFTMQELDLEVASEFLVMAATLLHIKSKMLLPSKKENEKKVEPDPREELVAKLVQYRRFKQMTEIFKDREKQWELVYYKLPETVDIKREDELLELSLEQLKQIYGNMIQRNRKKMDVSSKSKMVKILEIEKVSLKSKMKEIAYMLANRVYMNFKDVFSLGKRSRMEVVTGFLAILELAKLKKVSLRQEKQFSDILVYKAQDDITEVDFDESRYTAES